MTYLAPRQGLFAIILLVSFCLQTLLLVISTDQQLSKSRALKGEQMVAQLIDEARLSLENKDRVSLSVIANRYTSEQDVTRILIKDNNDDILVPVGNAPMQQGDTIRQIATNGDSVIGSVSLTLKDISKGEIIAMHGRSSSVRCCCICCFGWFMVTLPVQPKSKLTRLAAIFKICIVSSICKSISAVMIGSLNAVPRIRIEKHRSILERVRRTVSQPMHTNWMYIVK